jgi:hypothetical protein
MSQTNAFTYKLAVTRSALESREIYEVTRMAELRLTEIRIHLTYI